jgi:hypothetical protein
VGIGLDCQRGDADSLEVASTGNLVSDVTVQRQVGEGVTVTEGVQAAEPRLSAGASLRFARRGHSEVMVEHSTQVHARSAPGPWLTSSRSRRATARSQRWQELSGNCRDFPSCRSLSDAMFTCPRISYGPQRGIREGSESEARPPRRITRRRAASGARGNADLMPEQRRRP